MVTQLDLTQMEAMVQDVLELQKNIILARNYFNGVQEVFLSDRAKEFLGMHGDSNTFKLNVCRTIVTAVANELNLIGFDTNEPAKDGQPKEQAQWAMEVFKKNMLASMQDSVHEFALADSETFVIVEWDVDGNFPRMIHNPRFVDVDAGGEGMGVWMIYENDDPNQRPLKAVKQWIETTWSLFGTPLSSIRRTIYFPDHIERWVFDAGSWHHFIEDDKDWTLPWVDKSGTPLGLPVFHYKNKGLRAEHWDAITMQDAINKTLVDILASNDLTAFKSFFGFGFYPTIDGKEPKADGSNIMKMGPAQFNGTMKSPAEASLQEIEGSDSKSLMDDLISLILLTAQITDTPASKFVVTAQIASDKTIKEQKSELKKKATDRRDLFSTPWTEAMSMARKISNFYTNTGLNEDVQFIAMWEHSDSLDELQQKRETLGIPQEQLWVEAGYTSDQIAAMKNTPEYRVQYEKQLWEGATSATQNIPLETYLKRAGVSQQEIEQIKSDIENQSAVPSTEL